MKIWKRTWKSVELKRKWNFFGGSENGNGTAFSDVIDAETDVRFRLIRNFHFMVVLHGQSSRSNMWSCHIELSKQLTPTPPFTLSNLDKFGEQVFQFTWLAWVLLHDLDGLLVPIIIRFSSVFITYLFHICFRKYQFSYLFLVFLYLLLLPHKNMTTNMAPASSVRFRSVFIPTSRVSVHYYSAPASSTYWPGPLRMLPVFLFFVFCFSVVSLFFMFEI
jgi:hypothetical protein